VPDVKLRIKRENVPALQMIRLLVTSKNGSDETIINLNEIASNETDAYDSYKMMNAAKFPEIYTLINNERYVINSLNAKVLPLSLPLGVYVGMPDSLTVRVKEFSNLQHTKLVLHDKQENKFIPIDENAQYKFHLEKSTEERFEIMFGQNRVISDINTENPVGYPCVSFSKDIQEISIECGLIENADVEIVDLTGKVMFKACDVNSVKLKHRLETGMYVFRIIINNRVYTQKIIL